VADSFYVPLGDGRWQATVHTTGPWDARAQHAGPPSALLGRAMQECEHRADMMIARFTCEILRPIPVGEVSLTARVARPGRSVELLEAALSAGGREVARASAWRVLRTGADPVPSRAAVPGRPPDQIPAVSPPAHWVDGYLSAIEWRAIRGGFTMPGPASVWGRMRYPLVPDEEPSPLERVLVIADSHLPGRRRPRDLRALRPRRPGRRRRPVPPRRAPPAGRRVARARAAALTRNPEIGNPDISPHGPA
jgi:hypothetical protein